MSDISTLTTSSSVSPMRPTLAAQHVRDARRDSRLRRLALLLAIHDGLVEHAEPPQRALPAGAGLWASARKSVSTASAAAAGVMRWAAAIALMGGLRRPGGAAPPRLRVRSAVVGDRVHHRFDDRSGRAPSRRWRRPHGPGQLVALGDAVFQQVRVAGRALVEQRDGVLRVVELGQDDDAGAGVTLADLCGRVDALRSGSSGASGCRSPPPGGRARLPRRRARRSRRPCPRSRGRARARGRPGRPRARSGCHRRERR